MALTSLMLLFAGLIGWFVSTIAAGGGALLLIPIVSFVLGAQLVAPTVTLGAFIAAPTRVWLFRHAIDWQILKWKLPGTILGAVLGASLLLHLSSQLLQLVIGCFLISTVFQYRFGRKARSFVMQLSWFLPVGFVISTISGLVGGVGPVWNPFYLNYGVDKESLIATKGANALVLQLTKVSAYAGFGLFEEAVLWYGLMIGVGGVIGTILGKNILLKLNQETFRIILVIVMAISGVVISLQALNFL